MQTDDKNLFDECIMCEKQTYETHESEVNVWIQNADKI